MVPHRHLNRPGRVLGRRHWHHRAGSRHHRRTIRDVGLHWLQWKRRRRLLLDEATSSKHELALLLDSPLFAGDALLTFAAKVAELAALKALDPALVKWCTLLRGLCPRLVASKGERCSFCRWLSPSYL